MKNTRSLTVGDLSFHLPASWNAMSLPQLRFLAQLLNRERTSYEVCTMMLLYCIGGRVVLQPEIDDFCVIKLKGRRYAVTTDQLSDMAECFGFLFDGIFKDKPAITPALTMNPFPTISQGGMVLKGPSDGMLEIPFGSYVWLQTYLSGVEADPDNMNLALGSLWHSADNWTEPQDEDVALIRSLPSWQRLVMFWFVSGCISRMHRLFSRVFSGGGSAGGNVLDQQLRLLDSLAGSDMTKKEQVRSGKLIDALYVIDESIRKKEEYDKEVERMKQKHK